MSMKIETSVLGRDLAELNQGFLRLVAAGVDAGLSADVLARLRALDRSARHRLATVPFALFGFGFDEEAAWAELLSPGVRDLEPDYRACEPSVERFTLLALTVIRGFARTAPQSVSAWVGLTPGTRVRLASLQVGTLGVVAPLAAPRLRGRLAPRRALWLRFIEAVERNDARQLALLATLGQQWTIRRSLGLSAPAQPVRGFRR